MKRLLFVNIILGIPLLILRNVAAQNDSSCRPFLFYSANPNILNSTVTDEFISQIETCIGQARENTSRSSLNNNCYNCEEYVCALNCLTYAFNNADVCGNIIDDNIKIFSRDEYIILDWVKPLSDQIVSECIEYGTNESLSDKKAEKYPCNSQMYHFATCFFDSFDELYKSHVN